MTTTATESNGEWTITGHKSFVLDGAVADLLLVAARTGDGVGVFAVDASAAGLTRVPLETMDQTRKQARIEFDATPARVIGELDGGARAIETMLDHAMIALSAESLGGTARVLDMAVEYAKVREQFGRPIGSFQVIKHKCASMLVELIILICGLLRIVGGISRRPRGAQARQLDQGLLRRHVPVRMW